MTEEVERLLREIRRRSHGISSFVGSYTSTYDLQMMPFTVNGRIYHLSPDRFRSELVINGHEIIAIRKGHTIQRYISKRNEIWKYDLKGLPETEPINFGTADLKDPFFPIDESSLVYEGLFTLENKSTHVFTAHARNPAKTGLLDTRKGFSIRYQPKDLEIHIRLFIDAETGLLRRMMGSDKSEKVLFQSDYHIEAVNIAMDESLFTMDESPSGFKIIDMSEIFTSAINPDAADEPPSLN